MMASFKHHYSLELKLALLSLVLIFHFLFSPSISVGAVSVTGNDDNRSKQEKMVLGSRPPRCVNKCSSCRPCMAALVSPNHRNIRSSSYQDDESYYLLAWKCKCGNKPVVVQCINWMTWDCRRCDNLLTSMRVNHTFDNLTKPTSIPDHQLKGDHQIN